jgi:hypothetical protein
LISSAEAYEAFLAWEERNSRHPAKIVVLDLADIFTPLLRREPVRLVPIGMAPGRTIPPLVGERLKQALSVEALLAFQCPVTAQHLDVLEHFQRLLEGAEEVQLTPCSTLYVRSSGHP